MPELPSIPDTVPQLQAPRAPISPAQVAQPYAELAATLDKSGNTFSQASVALAEQAGYRAVTHDANGNVQVEQMPIFGDAAIAYHRAVKMAALADAEGEAKRSDLALRQKFHDNPGDPDNPETGGGYLGAAASFRKDMVDQYTRAAGADVGMALGRVIDSQTTFTYRGLINEKERLDLARADKSITDQIKNLQDDAVALARGGADLNSPELGQKLGSYATLLSEKVNNPRLAYPRESAEYEFQNFQGELAANRFLYHVDQAYQKAEAGDGYKAGMDAAKDILTNPDYKLSEQQRQAYYARAAGEIHANEALRRQDVGEARAAAQSLTMAAAMGMDIPPQNIDAVYQAFIKAGAPGQAAGFLATIARKPITDAQGKRPLDEQTQDLNALRAGAGFRPIIEGAAQKYGVDPLMLTRQLYQESRLNPAVRDSQAGAQGIAQFMPGTAAQYGVNVRDPQSSIEGAARYMADLKTQFGGNEGVALAAYNWGPGNVQKWQAAGADPNKLPAETRQYVQNITGQPIEAWMRGEKPSSTAGLSPAVSMAISAGQSRLVAKEARQEWGVMRQDWAKEGTIPNQRELKTVMDAARAAGDDNLLADIKDTTDKMDAAQQAARGPLPEQHARIAAAQQAGEAGALSPGDAAWIKDLQRRYDTVSKGLEDNPIATTVANFGDRFDAPPPLNVADPQQFAAGLQARGRIAQFAAQNWGVPPRSALDKADLAQVQAALDTPAPKVKAQIFGAITSALPEDVRNATLAKIGAGRPEHAVAAAAGALMPQAPDIAESILRGQTAIKADKGYLPDKTDAQAFKDKLATELPVTAFGLTARTDPSGSYAMMRGAVEARYADLSAQAADTSGKFDSDHARRLHDAVNDVTGGILTHNGAPLIAPARGMPQSQFEGVLASLTDRDLAGVTTLNGAPITANYVRQSAQLESTTEGRYRVRLGNDPLRPVYAFTGANSEMPQPFVLDLRGRTPAPVPPAPSLQGP